jgi:hypothetical protein
MDLEAVTQGLADVVTLGVTVPAGLPKLTNFAYVPDRIPDPSGFPIDIEVDWLQAFGNGLNKITLSWRVLVGKTEDRAAQSLLYALLASAGPTSVRAALAGPVGVAQTLGGACDDLAVRRVKGLRQYKHGEAFYVGADWVCDVYGSGSA